MHKRLYRLGSSLGFLALLSCASGAGGARARPATAVASHAQPKATVTPVKAAPAPLDYRAEGERDRAFIENAERAIGEYSEFIARAGEGAEYARAVRRSREQIEDLQAAIDFVRAGAAQRAAQPDRHSPP